MPPIQITRVRLAVAAMVCVLSACAVQPETRTDATDISVTQTARGVEIRSSDKILFNPGKADLKPGATAFLDQVATMLQQNTQRKVLVEGHTDSTGGQELNQELSELRALMVMKALVDRGVARDRISAKGYGASQPIASNSTAEGRQANRRTDIVIIGERKENLTRSNPTLLDQFSGWGKKLLGQD